VATVNLRLEPREDLVFWLLVSGCIFAAAFLIAKWMELYRRLKRENDTYHTNIEALVAARTQQWKTAFANLAKSYDITLEALGDALDLKEAEAKGHSRRVTAYTIAIARKMGLSKEEVDVIARGAFLHDIGKMAIPHEILNKPGKLTQNETAIMREHCYRGYKIISRIPFLSEAAEIVYSHQECYDGSGYPRGLKGDEIPLGARLVAVANTLDAMTSNRPYRPARTVEAARKEIELWSGRQFDPQIVKILSENARQYLGRPAERYRGLAVPNFGPITVLSCLFNGSVSFPASSSR
jgi:putative nucleotidyltransferase with HDIG domain